MASEIFSVSKKVLRSAMEEKDVNFFLELSNKGSSKIFVGREEVAQALMQKNFYSNTCKLSFLKESDEVRECFTVIEELSTHVKDVSYLTLKYELDRVHKQKVYTEKSVNLSNLSLSLNFNYKGSVPTTLTVKKGTPLMPIIIWFLTQTPKGVIMPRLVFKTALNQFTGIKDYKELFTLVKRVESLEDVKNLLLPLSRLTEFVSEYISLMLKSEKDKELHEVFARAINNLESSNKLSILSEGANYKVVFSVKEGSILLENKKTGLFWKIEDQGISKKEEEKEVERFLKFFYDAVFKDLLKHLKERREKFKERFM